MIENNCNELLLEFSDPKVDELLEEMLEESMSFSESCQEVSR